MISIPLIVTAEHECSYLCHRLARSAFVHPDFALTPAVYEQLVAQGFRRSGDEVYHPHCLQCEACIPVRLAVADFKANRSQKRCLNSNRHTTAISKPAVFEQAHYDMYLRYQSSRHSDGAMAHASPDDYMNFLGSSWCDSRFVEFSIADELAAIAVVDQFPSALSAVYTFFEPKFSDYSLGTYAVLWQIAQAQTGRREFLYLGYWLKECQKMAYKSNYQPLQIWRDGQWLKQP
jgi:arginine-tRNA-protein transferase